MLSCAPLLNGERSSEWREIESNDDWRRLSEEAREEYRQGSFFLDRLGAEKLVDPKLMATLLSLRQGLLNEAGDSVAERLLIDLTVLAYHHALRVSGWIGNLALDTERELFGQPGLAATMRARHGYGSEHIEGLQVEEYVSRIAESLLPLADRFNRMMRDNLKALREVRTAPSVRVEKAEVVSISFVAPGR